MIYYFGYYFTNSLNPYIILLYFSVSLQDHVNFICTFFKMCPEQRPAEAVNQFVHRHQYKHDNQEKKQYLTPYCTCLVPLSGNVFSVDFTQLSESPLPV